jgi:hypothetical protein
MLGWIPDNTRQSIVDFSEAQILAIVIALYRLGDVLHAPNDEPVAMLRERTSKPVLLMKRGIDTELFHAGTRSAADGILRLGYVGRIYAGKKRPILARSRNRAARARSSALPVSRCQDGSEREWLAANSKRPTFPVYGVRQCGARGLRFGCAGYDR